MSSDSSGEFHRIRRLPPYVFAEVNSAKAKARTAGEDIIDLGMGNPDSPTPRHIVEKLIETVQNPDGSTFLQCSTPKRSFFTSLELTGRIFQLQP